MNAPNSPTPVPPRPDPTLAPRESSAPPKADATVTRRPGKFWPICGLAVSALYLLNPGFGVFELLPDNLPGFGNLDEGGAMLLFVACLRRLRS